jgi:hypothetical protein
MKFTLDPIDAALIVEFHDELCDPGIKDGRGKLYVFNSNSRLYVALSVFTIWLAVEAQKEIATPTFVFRQRH